MIKVKIFFQFTRLLFFFYGRLIAV